MSESPLELSLHSDYIQNSKSHDKIVAMAMPIKIFSLDYPRPINRTEKEFLIRGLGVLDKSKPIPVPGEDGRRAVNWVYMDDLVMQIDSLIVIGKCQCGDPNCHTIQFQHHRCGQSEKIVELSLEDGRILSIYIDRERGLITQLEIIKD